MRHLQGLAAPLALALLAGCASTPPEPPTTTPTATHPAPEHRVPHNTLREAVVHTAAGLVGARTIVSGDRRIGYDCAGVVRAVFLQQGIDLYAGSTPAPRDNGVRRIHEHVRRNGRLHAGPRPQPGDLVFFDNTWDNNGDGRANDPLTHVGVVELVESDGTVHFISRVAAAIQRYRMNLERPHEHRDGSGRLLNDFLRRKRRGDRADVDYLAGELFAGFGSRLE